MEGASGYDHTPPFLAADAACDVAVPLRPRRSPRDLAVAALAARRCWQAREAVARLFLGFRGRLHAADPAACREYDRALRRRADADAELRSLLRTLGEPVALPRPYAVEYALDELGDLVERGTEPRRDETFRYPNKPR